MSGPKVSIIMSIYNESNEQIRESVRSILGQTFTDYEFIIVNDEPSNERLRSLSEELKKLDKRIRIIYNPKNIGLAMSMNKAARTADGEFLARMDADDIAHPDRIKEQIKYSHEADLIFSVCNYINEDGTTTNRKSTFLTTNQTIKTLPYKDTIVHPTVMIRKTTFEQSCGYRNFPCAQDYDLWLRLIEKHARLYSIEEPLLDYRIRDNGISNSNPAKQALTAIYIKRLHKERLKNNGKDGYSTASYQKFMKKQNIQKDNILQTKSQTLKAEFKSSTVLPKFAIIIKLLILCISSSFIRKQEIDSIKFKIALKLSH